jgi:hypothetical protein
LVAKMTGMLGALAAVAKAGCIFSRLCGQAKAGRRNDKPKVADRARDGLGYLNQFERHDRIINFPVWQTVIYSGHGPPGFIIRTMPR